MFLKHFIKAFEYFTERYGADKPLTLGHLFEILELAYGAAQAEKDYKESEHERKKREEKDAPFGRN